MTRAFAGLVTLMALVPARADESVVAPPPAPAVRAKLVKLDVREAARLVAMVWRADVVIVGGEAAEVTLDGDGAADARAALEQVARAAGLELVREGRLFVIGPHESVARVRGATRGAAGGKVTFDFLGVDGERVMRLVGEINKRAFDGKLAGSLSVLVRNFDSLAFARVLARLAGGEARIDKRRIAAEGILPVSSLLDAPACEPANGGDVQPPSIPPRLRCLELAEIEVAAIASYGVNALAAVRGRAAGHRLVELVRRGDRLGDPPARIESIEPDALVLDGGARLPLARR
ncbi:MAG TPA: hypothetical protein VFF06_30640 [Polyangia bacterium]|nr:hypothetical protein [Polyangia bacterium]